MKEGSAISTPEPIDGAEIVDRYWPIDGPYTAEALSAAAVAIAALGRYLAHATIRDARSVLPDAPGAYPMLGALMSAAHAQAQVLRQLAGWADALVEDVTLRHDEHHTKSGGGQAAAAALDAAEYLHSAAQLSADMGTDLSHATGLIGHLYHDMDWGVDR